MRIKQTDVLRKIAEDLDKFEKEDKKNMNLDEQSQFLYEISDRIENVNVCVLKSIKD